jgi:pre-rRNA-processing protein IPI3
MFLDVAGPITNVLVVRQEIDPINHISSNLQASTKKNPLEKYANSTDDESDVKTVISLGSSRECMDVSYHSSNVISIHTKELQVCVSVFFYLF